MKQARSNKLSKKIRDQKLNSTSFLDEINLSPIWNQDLALFDRVLTCFWPEWWHQEHEHSLGSTFSTFSIISPYQMAKALKMSWSRVSLSTSVKSSNKVVFLGSFPYCLYFGKHSVYHYHGWNSILLVVVVKILSYIEQEFRLFSSVSIYCYFLRL